MHNKSENDIDKQAQPKNRLMNELSLFLGELRFGAGYWQEQFEKFQDSRAVRKELAKERKVRASTEREWKKFERAVLKKVKQLDKNTVHVILSGGVCFDPINYGNYLNEAVEKNIAEKLSAFVDSDRKFLPGVVYILSKHFGAELKIKSKVRPLK